MKINKKIQKTLNLLPVRKDVKKQLVVRTNKLVDDLSGGGASSADAVSYDNTSSKLNATNVQSAIDEVGANLGRFVNPQNFGAVGDGVADDTNALRLSVKYANENKLAIKLARGKSYSIKGSINYYDDKYNDVSCDFVGENEKPSNSIGCAIIAKSGTSIFKNATITCAIKKVYLRGVRDLNTIVFEDCDLKSAIIECCYIENFGALLLNSSLISISRIIGNFMLSVFYFSRNTNTSKSCSDSFIESNYINGGVEQNDNSCFEFQSWNGSIVRGNFIDYYRCIYYPKNMDGSSSKPSVLPQSIGNNYQVFKYFYAAHEKTSAITFASVGDTFNWTNPSTLDKLRNFESLKYKYRDQSSDLRDMPNCIFLCGATHKIYARSVNIERNCNNIILFANSLGQYEYAQFDIEIHKTSKTIDSNGTQIVNFEGGCYVGGQYLYNEVSVRGIYRSVDALPSVAGAWINNVVGERIYYDHRFITLKAVWNGSSYIRKWFDDFGQEVTT